MKVAELRRLLAERGLAPRHRLGQNFLIDPALLEAIPADADVGAGERVFEVGPGAGALTERLLAAGAQVCAIEIDGGLASWLRQRFAADIAEQRLLLAEGDALDAGGGFHPAAEAWWASGPPPLLVANLPYAISGPFLARLPRREIRGACLLVQREVADKAAGKTARQRGPLALRLELAYEVRLGRRVPPQVFWPRPRVESCFLHLRPRPDRLAPDAEELLEELLRCAFGQRRKQLLPRLEGRFPAAAAALRSLGVDDRQRPEELDAAHWRAALFALLSAGSGPPRL